MPKAPKGGRPGANVTPLKKPEQEQRVVTHIVGAKLITGENIVGMRTANGIDEAMLVIAQPFEDAEHRNNLRVILIPYTIPLFIKRPGAPDVADKHIMNIYDVPAQLADHYLDKRAGMVPAEKE